MSGSTSPFPGSVHSHVFLGERHGRSERKTWAVIALCGLMMAAEILGGVLFGSVALIADGLHMSTHAGALLLTALAYRAARRYAHDRRFTFGTGKLGDLAGFTSAVVLAVIALLIGYEALHRFFVPVPIRFGEAILVAVLGLAVNIASVWLLADNDHHHHDHGHSHGHDHHHEDMHRDNNIRAAIVHVMADAAVSVLVIIGLTLAYAFGWLWMDPLAGIVGAAVIATWSYGLIRDTGSILLDMNPDQEMEQEIREIVTQEGDQVTDFHLWRLGPGHLGAIVSIDTTQPHDVNFYRPLLGHFRSLSHLTLEVQGIGSPLRYVRPESA